MKGFLRIFCAMILVFVLAFFFLWQENKLDFVFDAVTLLQEKLSGEPSSTENGADTEGNNGTDAEDDTPAPPITPGGTFDAVDLTQPENKTLTGLIYATAAAMNDVVDLSGYAFTRDEVVRAMEQVRYSCPELFYVDTAYGLNSISGSNVIKSVTMQYDYSKAQVVVMRTEYEAAIAEIVSGAPADGSDFDKLLYLHDHFITNYSYDRSLTIRDAYTFFKQKTGVCQAYMLALIATAKQLGIESVPVTSDAMMHAWNLVKLDGVWYHIDLTWDDNGTLPTEISYRYFLQSDAGLAAIDAGKSDSNRHHSWTAAETATDERYDAVVWRGASAPLVKANGAYYCVVHPTEPQKTRGSVYWGANVLEMAPLAAIGGGHWMSGESSFYTDCFSGLVALDGVLYYNAANTIYLHDLATGIVQPYLISLPTGTYIYGFYGIEDGKLQYLIATSPKDTATTVGIFPLP